MDDAKPKIEPDWLNVTLTFFEWPEGAMTCGDVKALDKALRAAHEAGCPWRGEARQSFKDMCEKLKANDPEVDALRFALAAARAACREAADRWKRLLDVAKVEYKDFDVSDLEFLERLRAIADGKEAT